MESQLSPNNTVAVVVHTQHSYHNYLITPYSLLHHDYQLINQYLVSISSKHKTQQILPYLFINYLFTQRTDTTSYYIMTCSNTLAHMVGCENSSFMSRSQIRWWRHSLVIAIPDCKQQPIFYIISVVLSVVQYVVNLQKLDVPPISSQDFKIQYHLKPHHNLLAWSMGHEVSFNRHGKTLLMVKLLA